jgi:hypothetical protein
MCQVIQSAYMVVLCFVLFELFNGITAQSPCVNSHISFWSFFTVKTNKGRKCLILESPISWNNDSFMESLIRQDRNDEVQWKSPHTKIHNFCIPSQRQLELFCETNFRENSIKPSQLFTFVQDTLQREKHTVNTTNMLYQVSINQHKLSYVAKQWLQFTLHYALYSTKAQHFLFEWVALHAILTKQTFQLTNNTEKGTGRAEVFPYFLSGQWKTCKKIL